MNFAKFVAGATLACLSLAAFATDPVPVCSDVAFTATAPATATVHADGPYFRAADGRYVLLRGVNATGDSKMPPFKTLTSPPTTSRR